MSESTSFQGKVVVVAGATGVLDSDAVRRALEADATVVGISRSAARLEALRERFSNGAGEPFHGVEGDLEREAAGAATAAAVTRVLVGAPIDPVVSAIGFVTVDGPLTTVSLDHFKRSLDDGLVKTFVAAKTFAPGLKAHAEASYTLVSGGFGMECSGPRSGWPR